MRAYRVSYSPKLSGTVVVQGAKNSAMKHVLMPLLAGGVWKLHNIPSIGSTHNLLEIVQRFGASVTWGGNTVEIDSTSIDGTMRIPADLFYYSSGGIFLLNILASRFGRCVLEKSKDNRVDYGGCQIGSRELSQVIATLNDLGIHCEESADEYVFTCVSSAPLDYTQKFKSFAVSVQALIAALYRDGASVVRKITGEAEFDDIVRLLQRAGARIEVVGDVMTVHGKADLRAVEFENMYDRHDAATWIAMALATNSELSIKNVDYKMMKLGSMQSVLDEMGVELAWNGDTCMVKAQLEKLRSVKIDAGLYPDFQTEWQVLFAPLLTQITGASTVVEQLYTNRMRHWDELKEMGAHAEYYSDARFSEKDGHPRAVRVQGPTELYGAHVAANDVRRGAALMIAGLIAEGETIVTDVEQIDRGYERFVERLQGVGGVIEEVEV